MMEILSPVEAELLELEPRLKNLLGCNDPLVNEMNAHLFGAGGKRLRPAAFLLGCKLLNVSRPDLLDLAAAFEYIHAASLLHDDVIDTAATRRNRPTVNSVWGDTVAILLGDRNYALACRVFVAARNYELIDTIARCIQEMSEGEIFQLRTLWKSDTSTTDYERVVHGKTAILFEACTLAPALLAETSPAVRKSMATFGHSLGMAFQIIDDCLDLEGESKLVGKPLLADLSEGKVTLPLILAMNGTGDCATRLRSLVADVCENRVTSPVTIQEIKSIVVDSGALAQAKQEAERHGERALEALRIVEREVPGHSRAAAEALERVVGYLSERKY